MGQTLYDKLWDSHVIHVTEDGTTLLYIDRHLLHEITTAQAFEGPRRSGRPVWRKSAALAVPDHNVPTTNRKHGIADPVSKRQVETLDANCDATGIAEFKMDDIRQGIVHVIGPEQGATLPGMTIVCGDSRTSTHGAFGALAHGVGTSEVEHVLATQTLWQKKSKNMLVRVEGELPLGCTVKDAALALIGRFGTAVGTGYAVEFGGAVIHALSMEARMTLCNMAIEAGARAGMVGVDETTIAYLKDRPFAPKANEWDRAVAPWRTFASDPDAVFDRVVEMNASDIVPQVTWGTSPEMVTTIDGRVPDPNDVTDPIKRQSMERALRYMGLEPNTPAAHVVKTLGRRIASNIRLAMVVPGSGLVKAQAKREGLDKIFIAAGFEWREPGCSMCLAMNADRLEPGERSAASTNRNFEGRQGARGRTHLVSPAMAAAAAIEGHFVDIRELA